MIGDREGVLTFFDDVELEYPRLAVDWDSIRKTILSEARRPSSKQSK